MSGCVCVCVLINFMLRGDASQCHARLWCIFLHDARSHTCVAIHRHCDTMYGWMRDERTGMAARENREITWSCRACESSDKQVKIKMWERYRKNAEKCDSFRIKLCWDGDRCTHPNPFEILHHFPPWNGASLKNIFYCWKCRRQRKCICRFLHSRMKTRPDSRVCGYRRRHI